MDSNSSDRDSGSGSQDAATESDPSIAPGSQGQSQDRSNHRRSSASAISSSQKQCIKDTFQVKTAPAREFPLSCTLSFTSVVNHRTPKAQRKHQDLLNPKQCFFHISIRHTEQGKHGHQTELDEDWKERSVHS
ncbi:hypothetical protein DFP72DRAFT_1166923 [Ephemerocybe angulata]|uniref:Uncharacterized protein n=1 Tax=Ephemerocybe angulata TaxID=980116 RepID=A0A8H6I6J2_9AGAR|nr:hypothetical protein DFP72DRAFT_1166923 [Tulosesus angulatus]